MNIMINDYCNLDCNYCFAKKLFSNDVKNISDENMSFYINFLKKSNMRELRILGGEPTLHPHFVKYTQLANEDDFFQNIMIFTNGLALDKDLINKIISPKIEFLINFNNPNKIGKEKYEKTCQNIQYLSNYFRAHNLPIRARLGINIDKKDFDYKYIIDKTLEFGFNAIRYSIIVPNTTGEQISLDYYKKFIPQIINFLNDCHKNNIMTSIDCNNIPKCLFTKDDLINMSLCNQDLVIKNHCGMPLDVDIDLNCTRCFPFFESNSINLRDFNNIEEIMRYFHYTIDRHRFNIPTFKECVDCQYFKENKCQGACLTYKF